MMRERLDWDDIDRLLADWPVSACDLALELREFVLGAAPELDETIAFKSLCYYRPGQPFGVIGGHVCMIGVRGDCVHVGFIHGAFLPDPDGLLQGAGKAKRHIELKGAKDIRRRAFKRLIRAAIAYRPMKAASDYE